MTNRIPTVAEIKQKMTFRLEVEKDLLRNKVCEYINKYEFSFPLNEYLYTEDAVAAIKKELSDAGWMLWIEGKTTWVLEARQDA
jgi:hypothetical protein